MVKLDESVTSVMNEYLEGDTIEGILLRNHKLFHYHVMFTAEQMKQDVEVLDLSPRAYHCLKRSGFNSIGNLINGVYTKQTETSKRQLLKLNNLGIKTADEILIKLFYYQFNVLPDSQKREYMLEVAASNN